MLKFLTHKLRTHSLNEDQPHQDKADDDHDSGTESDDENGEADDPESNSEQPCISPVLGQLVPLRSPSVERSQGAETVAEHGRKLSMESEAERSSGSAVSPFPSLAPSVASTSASAGPSAGVAALTACSPYFLDSALPSDSDHNYDHDHDHHSSEEELEVINSCPAAVAPASSDSPPEAASSGCRLPGGGGGGGGGGGSGSGVRPASGAGALLVTVRSGSVTVPEKRKWSQVTHQAAPHVLLATDCSPGGGGGSSSSSDDEVQGLLAAMSTPVRFRTWPPLDAHKPGRSLSPPPKLFHYAASADAAPAPACGLAPAASASSASAAAAAADASPRKRHRHTPRASHIQRPCLDFEKMQQLKARAVTAWRHGGDRGGELSVFCW
ncbi:homeotic protein female sterile isoform X1 [Schistocerca gregaria]|uniref:homeotic protein female sterile isoform X1 n=2 Tax=Schistocerca gregaria TaxID=7010 RepID=UPI00211DE727|nr:homeotic protein female sterile isoform X1 [Schistocerca gregaria]